MRAFRYGARPDAWWPWPKDWRRDSGIKSRWSRGRRRRSPMMRREGQRALPWALHSLRIVSQADRCYLFENHMGASGELLTSQRFEDCAEGVEPQQDNPESHGFPWIRGGMGRWVHIMSRNGEVCGDVTDFPDSE